MILGGKHADTQDLARFRAEAVAVVRLQHPNIVQVYEVGEQDGQPFFSLEYVDGTTLAAKIQHAPLTAAQAANLVQTIARAIHVAHENGIVHRDLKPANVLLTADDIPKITDFGLAKRVDEAGETRTGQVMGTPCYMAPEQAQGKIHSIGPATDVYALGAMLYEMLAGAPPSRRPPHWKQCASSLRMIRCRRRAFSCACRATWRPSVSHCLEKQPHRRYPSALALADDLHRFLAGEPIHARPTRLWERAWKWARRRPAVASLAAATVLVTILGFAIVSWKWREAESARVRADEQRQLADAHYHLVRMPWTSLRSWVRSGWSMNHTWNQSAATCAAFRLAFYQRLLHERSTDPIMLWETGRAQCRVGDIQQMLGEHAAAEDAYRAAENLLSELVDRFPENHEYIHDLATCYVDHGELLKNLGHLDEAERTCHVALQQQDKVPARPGYRQERCLPRTSWASSCTNAIAFGRQTRPFALLCKSWKS